MFSTGIVVHSRGYFDGTVLEGAAGVARARAEGSLVLPYEKGREPEFLGGYFRRGWGEGWLLDRLVGQRICPMLVRVEPDRPWLYWAAAVWSEGGASGSLRLVSDTSYPGAQATAISAGQDDILLERLEFGRPLVTGLDPRIQYVGGRRRISVAQPGFLALNLYATATNASVVVSAVSQVAVDVAYP